MLAKYAQTVGYRRSPALAATAGLPGCCRERLNAALHGGATAQDSASRSHLFGQMREIHGEDMHIVGRKLGEAYVPVEPGSPLVAMPDVQMQSM